MAILVTGAAGFIGMHLAQRLLAEGYAVLGVDSLNSYYDLRLKEERLARLRDHTGFDFLRLDLADSGAAAALAELDFDTRELAEAIQWIPSTPLGTGIRKFADWFGVWSGTNQTANAE